MRRTVKSVNISQWTAEDIDRYAPHVAASSKTIETQSLLTDIEAIDELLKKHLNEKPPAHCGFWHESLSAMWARESTMDVLIIMRRVRLNPDNMGCVFVIKWEKE